MLREGEKYSFRIQRIVEMPPDQELFFVLEGPDEKKFLLQELMYRHYNLKPGQELICRVDKINCSGRIYLEPDHPFCAPGDLVGFTRIARTDLINSMGQRELLLMLEDPWGQSACLNISAAPKLDQEVSLQCRVERIKKGELQISHPSIEYFGSGRAPEEDEAFQVAAISTLSPNNEYYRLQQGDSFHYLKCRYYQKYHIQKDTQLQCDILGKPALFHHYLEPLHPYYRKGESYDFDFLRKENQTVHASRTPRLVVSDLLGHEYTLEYDGEIPQWIRSVRAKVLNIRMSKLILEAESLT